MQLRIHRHTQNPGGHRAALSLLLPSHPLSKGRVKNVQTASGCGASPSQGHVTHRLREEAEGMTLRPGAPSHHLSTGGGGRQVDGGFKVILGYILSSRTAWAAGDGDSNKTKRQKNETLCWVPLGPSNPETAHLQNSLATQDPSPALSYTQAP